MNVTPLVVATIDEVRRAVAAARSRSLSLGFVPTMGALHEGHASLLRAARQECGFVIASIFVNPTQFGPNEDFKRYPRTLDADLDLCRREGADVVFTPEPSTVYPHGFRTYVEVAGLQDLWEGAARPGHFRGVTTVVLKLYNIVQPDTAYFGQKDAQQVRIIEQMVRDLNLPVRVRVCPTVREPDGLALSSRNRYLSAEEREQARVLSQALFEAKAMIAEGARDAGTIREHLATRIRETPGAVLDYVAVLDANSFQEVPHLKGRVLLVLAARIGTTRLIDNVAVDMAPCRTGDVSV
jgi:pantoate--beta-alanine ligase